VATLISGKPTHSAHSELPAGQRLSCGAGHDVTGRGRRRRFFEDGAGRVSGESAERRDRRRLGAVARVLPEAFDQELRSRRTAEPGEGRDPHIGFRVGGGDGAERVALCRVFGIEPFGGGLPNRPEGIVPRGRAECGAGIGAPGLPERDRGTAARMIWKAVAGNTTPRLTSETPTR